MIVTTTFAIIDLVSRDRDHRGEGEKQVGMGRIG